MKKILVIEDDPHTRHNLVTILRIEGYDPHGAEDGRTGIELARQERPDLILCDVTMPEMTGYDVITALREDPATAHIPFIFLTARGGRGDVRAGMNLGADDYLTKPASATELLSAVEARFKREEHRPPGPFKPDFSSPAPLEKLGLTPREAEVLLWIAQGKANSDIAILLGAADATIKKHVQNIFEKLGVETRNAATVRAFEVLSPAG